MTGLFSPVVWEDGEEPENTPSADDLNTEWRDSFNFLLGYTRPIAHLYSTTGTSIPSNTETSVPFNNEKLLRGSMVHSTVTNSHQLTVPVTGQYQGYILAGFDTFSVITTKAIIRLKKNATTVLAVSAMKPEATAGWNIAASFTADLVANDILSMTMQSTASTAVMGTALTRVPRMVVYYVGDYV